MTLKEIAAELALIKSNHLHHMAQDIEKLDKRIEKMDMRVWTILLLLVGAIVIPAVVTLIRP